MNIEIYGIDEANYRCAGCSQVKRMCDEAGLPYEFKRIVYLDDQGFPTHNKDLLKELRSRINVGLLKLPYIFVDDRHTTFVEFEQIVNK